MDNTRREFLEQTAKALAAGTIGLGVLNTADAKAPIALTKPASQPATRGASAAKDLVEKRPLGGTGLAVSVISVGTASANSRVIDYAIRKGINFIHTSTSYSGGRSIKEVAKAIKGKRHKVYLGLKITWNWDDDESLNKALKTLGTDYVDVMFYNIHNNPALVASEKAKTSYERWKKQGKVRFLGLTTHSMMKQHMEAALKTGWYHCLMPAYKLNQRKEYLQILEQCEKKKVGIVAMKTGVGGKKLDHVPVLLRDKALTTINRTATSFAQVNELIEASKRKVTDEQVKKLLSAAETAAIGRCMMCGSCTGACPAGLAVNDIVRCCDYYVDAMQDLEVAAENYRQIADGRNALYCTDCGTCEGACPNNVPVRHFVRRARNIFA